MIKNVLVLVTKWIFKIDISSSIKYHKHKSQDLNKGKKSILAQCL